MAVKMSQIRKTRLSDQMIGQILKLISGGTLKVGDKLQPEKTLAEEFGVGRSTVREAMHALSVMGIISVKPGRGAVIIMVPDGSLELPLKWNSLKKYPKAEELVETRVILEQGMVDLAMKNASDTELSQLQKIVNEMEEALTNREKYIEKDLAFHSSLAGATHNELLIKLYNEIKPLVRTWLERQTPYITNEQVRRSFQRHKLMLQTIKEKNAVKARATIRKHIEMD